MNIFRFGLGLIQGIFGLFAAGSILFGAHSLFLRYYAREWAGIQLSGVNGCAGEEMIANGDLIGGQTLCNKPINFVPWVVLYQHHWVAALLYYGLILFVIIAVGVAVSAAQHRRAPSSPFGHGARPSLPADSEHLS